MKFSIPKIVQPLPLTGYAPEAVTESGAPAVVWVWVNPPHAFLQRRNAAGTRGQAAAARMARFAQERATAGKRRRGRGAPPAALQTEVDQLAAELEAIGWEMAGWYAELWSQGADPATHWTADEVVALDASETDPGLGRWIKDRSVEMVNAHREGQAKK
jgi:hypothetical protein